MEHKKKILVIEGNDSKEGREVKKIIKEAGYIYIGAKDVKTALNYMRNVSKVKVGGVLASASRKRSGGRMKTLKHFNIEFGIPYNLKVLKSEGHRAWKKALKDIEFYL